MNFINNWSHYNITVEVNGILEEERKVFKGNGLRVNRGKTEYEEYDFEEWEYRAIRER